MTKVMDSLWYKEAIKQMPFLDEDPQWLADAIELGKIKLSAEANEEFRIFYRRWKQHLQEWVKDE